MLNLVFLQIMPELFVVILLTVVLCVLTGKWLLNSTRKLTNLPPGPFCLPIVGYLPFLTTQPHLKLQRLSKKYGDIFSIQLASWDVVVLNTAELIKEAFSKPEFLGRPEKSLFSVLSVESPFFVNGKIWHEQRPFVLRVLRSLGLGKSIMHEHLRGEVMNFIEAIKKGKTHDIRKLLTPSVSNNICSLVFGESYNYSDPQRLLLDNALENVVKYIGQTSMFVFFPWLKKLPFLSMLLKLDHAISAFDSFHCFAREKIKQHKVLLDSANLHDFIDYYLYEMESKLEEGKTTTFSEELLLGSVVALFGGGSSTVQSTLSWCFCIMATYPEVQKKVQEEIDLVIGHDQTPEFSDQKNMPYTQSVLMEIQRWQTVLPLSVLRMTLNDCNLCGYIIPKNTVIIANLWAAHHNPDCWYSPNEFIADRFLSSDGKSVLKCENYIPFSYGKRSCPGEGLATVEVFLYFTSILQKFKVSLPEGEQSDLKGTFALTYEPNIQNICFLPRF